LEKEDTMIYRLHRETENTTTDSYGNNIDVKTGDYVIFVGQDVPTPEPLTLTLIDNEWTPVQMELPLD
jgi:hypothetical protein